MTRRIFSAILLLALAVGLVVSQASAAGTTYWVSNSGSGTACTYASPCAWSTGTGKLVPGDTLAIKGIMFKGVTLSKSGTASARITLTGDEIHAPASYESALVVAGSYVTVRDLEVIGGGDFGIRVKGNHVTILRSYIHDSVLNNRNPTTEDCYEPSGGWGRGLTFAYTANYAEVSSSLVYRNCGEGIAFTQNSHSYLHDSYAFDNFSRNVYIGNAAYVTVENIKSYYSDPKYYRDGLPGRCIGLAIETTNYNIVGNNMHDALIQNNDLHDCKGINFYQEVAGQYPSNVTVQYNYLYRMVGCAGGNSCVSIPGTNIVVNNNYSGGPTTPTLAPTFTAVPTATRTSTPTPTSSIPTLTPTPTAAICCPSPGSPAIGND